MFFVKDKLHVRYGNCVSQVVVLQKEVLAVSIT